MSDLTLEILMGALVLCVVFRMSGRGNPRPGLFVAIGGAAISAAAAFRRLELSDIIIPLVVAVISGLIAAIAHGARPNTQAN